MKIARRRLLLGTAMAATGAGRAAVAVTPTSGVAVHERQWTDREREREVPVRLYWPDTAAAPVPLVLFSHGFGSTRGYYGWLGESLAAQGIASLHPQHAGSDLGVWMGGPPLWILRELQGEGMALDRVARVADMRFVLDQLLASEWGPRIDAGRIAAAGHSLGAQTALLCGGARLSRGKPLREPRVNAVVSIGVARFAGETDMPAVLRPVAVPSLHITTEEDTTSMPGYAATADDRVAFYRATGGPAKVLAVFQHGNHNLFTDAGLEAPVLAATAELVHGFLRAAWQGERAVVPAWRERHRALISRFEQAGSMPAPGGGMRA